MSLDKKTKVVEHVPRIIFHVFIFSSFQVLQNIPGSKLLSDIQTFLFRTGTASFCQTPIIYVHNLTGPPECDPTTQSGQAGGDSVGGDGACNGCSTTGRAECREKCNDHPDCAGWTVDTAAKQCWLKVEGFEARSNNGDGEGWLWGRSCKGKQVKSI